MQAFKCLLLLQWKPLGLSQDVQVDHDMPGDEGEEITHADVPRQEGQLAGTAAPPANAGAMARGSGSLQLATANSEPVSDNNQEATVAKVKMCTSNWAFVPFLQSEVLSGCLLELVHLATGCSLAIWS